MPEQSPTIYAHALLTLARAKPSEDLTKVYERIGGLVAVYGSVREVVIAMAAGEISVPLAPEPLFLDQFVESAVAESARLAESWATTGVRVHAYATPSYPRQLEEIADAPPLLFEIGEPDVLTQPGIAIVGTRKASRDGLRRARSAAQTLCELGITVISGMAVGIDSAAHEAALAAGGRTIAVMGTAIDKRYPAENKPLAERIVASGGALVSEYGPTVVTQPWHFLRRNRTMSGLALGTLVIEASDTSGAKSQALAAVQHGRPVFLLSSLVQSHQWASRLVHEGVNGSYAIEVGDRDELATLVSPGRAYGDEPSFG